MRNRRARYLRKIAMDPEALAEKRKKDKERQRRYRENKKRQLLQEYGANNANTNQCNTKSDYSSDSVGNSIALGYPNVVRTNTAAGCHVIYDYSSASSELVTHFNNPLGEIDCRPSVSTAALSKAKPKLKKTTKKLRSTRETRSTRSSTQNYAAALHPFNDLSLGNAEEVFPCPSPPIPVDIIKIEREEILE